MSFTPKFTSFTPKMKYLLFFRYNLINTRGDGFIQRKTVQYRYGIYKSSIAPCVHKDHVVYRKILIIYNVQKNSPVVPVQLRRLEFE